MKYNKFIAAIAGVAVAASGISVTSCSDKLELSPNNSFTGSNFWGSQTEFETNIIAMTADWRGFTFQNNYLAGELRAGYYLATPSAGLDYTVVSYTSEILNDYTPARTQFSNFASYYQLILDINLFLYQAENTDVMSEEAKAYMLGIVYGLRARAYFYLYRMYGGVPLRLEPDVALGNFNVQELYMERAQPSAVMAQIKKDLDASLSNFSKGKASAISAFKASSKAYWNEASTKMLAGEVYMWSAKVTTGDQKATGAADIAKAKGYFTDVINNYGLSLSPDFFSIFAKSNASNPEIISYVAYDYNDGAVWDNNTNNFACAMPAFTTNGGAARAGQYWWPFSDPADNPAYKATESCGPEMMLPRSTTAYKIGYKADGTTRSAFYYHCSQSLTRQLFKNALFYQFDENDIRRRSFADCYLKTEEEVEAGLNTIENFDFDSHILAGCYFYKLAGEVAPNGYIVGGSNIPVYRLTLAYAYMAEIANYEGKNSEVEYYLNEIRKRAYGDNWDESKYGYKAGLFRENEAAILHEKDKEFIQEGQRWWDIRRLTSVKDGNETDHLVFQPESSIGWGLPADLAAKNEVVTSLCAAEDMPKIDTNTPILKTTEAYKVLWPVDATLLGDDPKIEQTPGYGK